MKFTIENFKTSIFRPAEWLAQSDTIVHLINDLNKEYNGVLMLSRGVNESGTTFFIKVYKNIDGGKISEDDCTILAIRFKEDEVDYKDNFEELAKMSSEMKTEKHSTIWNYIPYWTAVKIIKKINSTVFKVLQEMQNYPTVDIFDEGSVEIIHVPKNE